MRLPRTVRTVGPLFASAALCGTLACVPSAHAADLGHAVLAAKDGWASATTGTTGGSKADAAHTVTVSTRAQLVAALGGKNSGNGSNATAKIIYVSGVIDLNTDDSGKHLDCSAYATGGYSLPAYLAAYDPKVWGTSKVPSGTQEDARAASQKKQADKVQINVGANTTLVGVNGGTLRGGGLVVKNVDNVIVRNLSFENAADCFPQWDPTDGSTGNWNSEYDAMTVYGATHVWVDHNTFSDGAVPDSSLPSYFGRIYEVHDGLLDVVKGADYVTSSWNVFKNHDKTNLIGNSDSASATDAGHLRVTFHHNLWQNTVQRAPRVRFGQVDAYNNYYVPSAGDYEYSLGVGKSSQLVAQNNYFALPSGITAAKVLYNWGGTALTAGGNSVNGTTSDLIAAWNAANSGKQLGTSAGWTPTLRTGLDAANTVPAKVTAGAGVGHL
ncbi:pectate lyase family protein [Kitasatospora cineracea]|uniref:Pectate lyase n=1 Tax=Kitasatospora cineracea TaxID=88074 RepID=A0A3N4R3M5_9ACTN|nr:polysaccharide lyase family 1 protein [Kitasatospora cineracea]ROR35694.1 pectate lyase [Kitasatospora cineracea]RPE27782.1 pectate lyase [Kitasatospora cineracea]